MSSRVGLSAGPLSNPNDQPVPQAGCDGLEGRDAGLMAIALDPRDGGVARSHPFREVLLGETQLGAVLSRQPGGGSV